MRLFIVWVLSVILLFFPQQAEAHGANAGVPVSINGDTVSSYSFKDASVYSSELIIPNDRASQNYLEGEELSFEADLSGIEDENSVSVSWDLGDGSKSEGAVINHTYENPGSYFVTVESSENGELLASEIILVNIVPDENYVLPEAIISINREKATADDFNILEFDLADKLEFDGSGSSASDSKIVSYTWDFGDDKTATGSIVDHQYVLPQAFATVLLRVEDENGLISDAIVNVRNIGNNEPDSVGSQILGLVIPAAIVILIIGGGLALFRKKK